MSVPLVLRAVAAWRRPAGFCRDESGALIVLSLFIFVMILMIAGMAVDLMRHETRRVAMQNTLDTAILAASSLSQQMEAETLIKDHVAKAGLDPNDVQVLRIDDKPGAELVSRQVAASTRIDTDTMFMGLLGIENLTSGAGGVAEESVMNIEISLILDISGSMGRNDRLKNLKVAAKDFVEYVLTNGPNASRTSISIVPYNATVVAGDALLARLNAGGTAALVATPAAYPGALDTYPTEHGYSTCVRFDDADFAQRAIGPATPLRRVAHFDRGGNGFARPGMSARWCNENRSAILPHEVDAARLKAHIDALTSGGWTGIDNGMKWGVALLDPAIRPVIDDMVMNGMLAKKVAGRPGAYNPIKTKKIIVLMTDGANTIQRDLDEPFRNGPSRIWFAESRTSGTDAQLGRSLTEFDGYFVEMPDNDPAQRWYVPGNPKDGSDDLYMAEGALPADARQLHYIEVYERFAHEDVAEFFFKDSDKAAYEAHRAAVIETESYGSIDDRLRTICDAAKKDGDIEVFAIGFEAPAEGLAAMRNCASSIGNYFDVQGTEISQAFDSIAGQIALLRLKE